ncbi:MAG: glycosyltransferase, partial [bacterium]
MARKLKILMIDKYYFIKGGAERYYFELAKLLEAQGHQVIPFSMQHNENLGTSYSDYFVDFIDYNNGSKKINFAQSLKIAGRMLYSIHSKRKLEALIEHVKPDLAHLHMIDHQISPSILHTLKNHEIPVIQTVHQYKLVCPNYRLYNTRTNSICEKCLGGHYLYPITERCHKNSFAAGLLLALETYLHRFLSIYENVD